MIQPDPCATFPVPRTVDAKLLVLVDEVRQQFRDRDLAAETLRCKLAEAQLVNRRLADELARRGATETDITRIITEACR